VPTDKLLRVPSDGWANPPFVPEPEAKEEVHDAPEL